MKIAIHSVYKHANAKIKCISRPSVPVEITSIMAKPILIEVGAGELIDKWTILRIKQMRIANPDKLANIARELEVLAAARNQLIATYSSLSELEAQLQSVNEDLWKIEDDIRICERHQDFSAKFIQLARSVYIENDRRAVLKKKINVLCGAEIIEEKSYEEF